MTPMIIFNSHTGFTEAYADLLSKTLDCPSIPSKKLPSADLSKYDTLIYGGGVRASKISGFNKALQSFRKYPDKKVIIFAVGGNGLSEENTQILKEKNLDENNVDYPFFYMQGGFDPNKLNFALKAMLNGVAKSIKKKEASDPNSLTREDKEFLDFFQEAHNDVNQANTKALVDYISQL